jgi:hypothetical protein
MLFIKNHLILKRMLKDGMGGRALNSPGLETEKWWALAKAVIKPRSKKCM